MDQTTIDTYNQMSGEYDAETSSFWDMFPHIFVDKFVATVGTGKVLDVGSGPGRDGLILQNLGLKVICLDASRAMVELCQGKGLEAAQGDFNDIPFANGVFDGIWAYTSLLHVPKSGIARSFQELTRVLKPGGVLGLGMIEGNSEGYRESTGVKKPRWFSYYAQAELSQILLDHGFHLVYFESFQPKTSRYLNFVCTKAD